MRIIVIPAQDLPHEKFVPDADGPQLDALQKIVGGYIQPFLVPKYPSCVLLTREFDHPTEEAHAPLNDIAQAITGFPLHGDVVLVGQAPPDFVDVPVEVARQFAATGQ